MNTYIVTIRIELDKYYSYTIRKENRYEAAKEAAKRFVKHTKGKYAIEDAGFCIQECEYMQFNTSVKSIQFWDGALPTIEEGI